ncbi:hypothetical protein AB6E77_09815, partial [Vibrio sp. 10N.247.311.18]|uniref:hypothetical protein n=1 Tax=unclassified Vibrio TaxID=2614977 RepID=UPI00354F10BF
KYAKRGSSIFKFNYATKPVLAALSKGKKLTDDYRNDAEFLITYQEKLLPEDTVYQLIEIIKNALEVLGES